MNGHSGRLAILCLSIVFTLAAFSTASLADSIRLHPGTNLIGIPGLGMANLTQCVLANYSSTLRTGCQYNKAGSFVRWNANGTGKGDCGNNYQSSGRMEDGFGYFVSVLKDCVITFRSKLTMNVTLYPGINLISVPVPTSFDQLVRACGQNGTIFRNFTSSQNTTCRYDRGGSFVTYNSSDSNGDCKGNYRSEGVMRPNIGYYVNFRGKDGAINASCTLNYVNGILVNPPRSKAGGEGRNGTKPMPVNKTKAENETENETDDENRTIISRCNCTAGYQQSPNGLYCAPVCPKGSACPAIAMPCRTGDENETNRTVIKPPVVNVTETCLKSGGVVQTGSCCGSAKDFPNSCAIGACGCSPANSHDISVCACPAGKCFNGVSCVLAGSEHNGIQKPPTMPPIANSGSND